MSSSAAPRDREFGPFPISHSEIFFETELSFCFVNLKPLLPGHVLVSPKRVLPRFADLTPLEVADLWGAAQRVGSALERHLACSAITFAVQDGAAAGQTVPHVHVHVLPRRGGDFTPNDKIYEALDENEREAMGGRAGQATKLDLDIERRPRTREEMAAEAAVFRALLTLNFNT